MPLFTKGRRFSFNIFNDLPGALSSSSSSIPELSLHQKDAAYAYQTSGTHQPWLLTSNIFFIASILDSEYQSKKTYEQLEKMSLISAEGAISTAPMDKPGFGKDIMSRCAFIPQIKIKMVVEFLFWWAEEDQRLRNLCHEKEDLTAALNDTANSADTSERRKEIEILLQQVGMRLAARPSQRDAAVESSLPAETLAGDVHSLPPYESIPDSG